MRERRATSRSGRKPERRGIAANTTRATGTTATVSSNTRRSAAPAGTQKSASRHTSARPARSKIAARACSLMVERLWPADVEAAMRSAFQAAEPEQEDGRESEGSVQGHHGERQLLAR